MSSQYQTLACNNVGVPIRLIVNDFVSANLFKANGVWGLLRKGGCVQLGDLHTTIVGQYKGISCFKYAAEYTRYVPQVSAPSVPYNEYRRYVTFTADDFKPNSSCIHG